MQYAVETRDLGKVYRLYSRPSDRLIDAVTFGAARRHHEHWALRGVNMSLRHGGALAICGGNGAGKSTLLRVLAGVTSPTEGGFRVDGKISSLLELGLGFQPDLSGRANITTKGMLLGMRRRELRTMADAIIEFSELGDFIDLPLRTYSSGMAMRLGFSVAIATDPDLLVLDEVFGVGDAAFQEKCIDRIHEFKRRNKTILFCSHSPIALRQLCDEAVWVRDGRIHESGDVVSVTGHYQTWMTRLSDSPPQIRSGAPLPVSEDANETRQAPHIVKAHIRDATTGEPVSNIRTHDSIEICAEWMNPRHPGPPLHLAVGFLRQDNIVTFGVGTYVDGHELKGPRGSTVLRLPNLALLSGEYLVIVWLLDESGLHKHEERLIDEPLVVESKSRQIGIFAPPHEWIEE